MLYLCFQILTKEIIIVLKVSYTSPTARSKIFSKICITSREFRPTVLSLLASINNKVCKLLISNLKKASPQRSFKAFQTVFSGSHPSFLFLTSDLYLKSPICQVSLLRVLWIKPLFLFFLKIIKYKASSSLHHRPPSTCKHVWV